MKWEEVRQKYPDQWLVIEALEAYSEKNLRMLTNVAVVAICVDGGQALQKYQEMHHQHPDREYYYIHTSRLDLHIEERHWAGIRGLHNNHAARAG